MWMGLSYRQGGKRNNSGFNGVCLEATLDITSLIPRFFGFLGRKVGKRGEKDDNLIDYSGTAVPPCLIVTHDGESQNLAS